MKEALKKHMEHAKANPGKVEIVMHEFKEGKLHSGSDHGPKVKNPKQAIAIAIHEGKRA
jgi:hypothetical protein